jgi:hypothetical protein
MPRCPPRARTSGHWHSPGQSHSISAMRSKTAREMPRRHGTELAHRESGQSHTRRLNIRLVAANTPDPSLMGSPSPGRCRCDQGRVAASVEKRPVSRFGAGCPGSQRVREWRRDDRGKACISRDWRVRPTLWTMYLPVTGTTSGNRELVPTASAGKRNRGPPFQKRRGPSGRDSTIAASRSIDEVGTAWLLARSRAEGISARPRWPVRPLLRRSTPVPWST